MSMTETHAGGVVGLLARFKRHAVPSCKPENIVLNVLLATGMAAVLYYANERAADGPTAWFIAVIGCAAVYYCAKGSEINAHAWFNRRPFKFLASGVILAGAFVIEAANHLSVGSKNNDQLAANRLSLASAREIAEANHNAALQARAAARKNLEDVQRAKSINETSTMSVNGASITTPDAARSIMDKAKAHRFWGVTESCTATKGPETRKFCEEYRNAEAAFAVAKERVLKGEDLKAEIPAAQKAVERAEAEVKAAAAALAAAPVVTSKERADTRNLRKVANAFGVTDVDDNLLSSLLFLLGLTLFISIRKWMLTAELYEGLPRKPWGVAAFLKGLAYGRKEDAAPADNAPPAAFPPVVTGLPEAHQHQTPTRLVPSHSTHTREVIRVDSKAWADLARQLKAVA